MAADVDWGGLKLEPEDVFPWNDEMLEAGGRRDQERRAAVGGAATTAASAGGVGHQRPVGAGGRHPAPRPMARIPAHTAVYEHALLEAAVFKSELHPRWPKGSGKKAGEFMEVGQVFTSGGKTWQIAHIVKGRIYAHEASADYKRVGDQERSTCTRKPATGSTIVPT
jgi:cation diffusion facilitator CzcD-associated flavoprotein CzcO